MIWFTIMSIVIWVITSALIYEAWNLQHYMFVANCKLAQMIDVINYGDGKSSWVGV